MIALIRAFAEQGKPIGAICHGPWLLVEADLLRGRTATSWPSIRTDLRNAGANVVDEPAVTDGNIVTSRNPDDVEAFTNALIDLIEDMPGGRGDSHRRASCRPNGAGKDIAAIPGAWARTVIDRIEIA